jgi:tetratricopeptide (TPR) repeat protein
MILALVVNLPATSQSLSSALFSSADQSKASGPTAGGRILLVLPFDNRSSQPSLEWMREAAAEILSSRFISAGFAPMSRPDRLYALDHLGLPQGFQPSRASSLKLAQTLDADSIVVGSFQTEGTDIVAEARLVDVPHLRMSDAVTARGPLSSMMDIFDSLAWKLTRQLDPSFNVAQETFIAAGHGLRLDAFEQYIRGITEPDQQERLRHLKQAVQLSPAFGPAWMALGREDYSGQQYDDAAAAFAKVDRNDPDALEANFYRGISLLFSGNYPQAEAAFSGVARILPLAQVLNNQGVALSRQNKDGSALFRQAVTADPNNADYHFNLAVSLKRHGNAAEALTELTQSLHLHPNDAEALDLQDDWKSSKATHADPLERIVRSFDAAAFRQAAQMMDQMEASRLAALTPHEQALRQATQAADYLDRGLLLEAERLYQAAATEDNKLAVVHAGLAEVRERTGDADSARREARLSLELMPSASAYLVLGRLDLGNGKLNEATTEVNEAVKIEPNSKAASELRHQIEAKGGSKN